MIYDYENYYKNYYIEHREKYLRSNRKYLEKTRRHCIYLLTNKDDNVMYVGSTNNIFSRMSFHLKGFGYLNLNEKNWTDNNYKCFKYAYLDAVNKTERLYIEGYLINKYRKKNKLLNIYNNKDYNYSNITEERKCKLEELAESLE